MSALKYFFNSRLASHIVLRIRISKWYTTLELYPFYSRSLFIHADVLIDLNIAVQLYKPNQQDKGYVTIWYILFLFSFPLLHVLRSKICVVAEICKSKTKLLLKAVVTTKFEKVYCENPTYFNMWKSCNNWCCSPAFLLRLFDASSVSESTILHLKTMR